MGMEINDGKFSIKKGQGLSQAIADEIGLTKEQRKKVDWRSVFDILDKVKGFVKPDDESGIFENGFNKVVHPGDTFEFSTSDWECIVNTVKNSLEAKNINTDNLKEIGDENLLKSSSEKETDKEDQISLSPVRFMSRKIDKKKTYRREFDGNNLIKYYDAKGVMVKEVHVFSTNQTEEIYYNEKGVKTHKNSRNSEGGIMHIEVFDDNGNVVSWQDEKGNVHRKEGVNSEVKFDSVTGKISSFTEYDPKGVKTNVIEFNSSGKVTLHTEYDEKGNKKAELYNNGAYCLFEYDEKGNNTKEVFYNARGELSKYQLNEFDVNGNKIHLSIHAADEELIQSIGWEYDENGNNTKFIEYDENGEVYTYSLYEYDSEGNRLKSSNFKPDGTPRNYHTYEYDKNGNQIKEAEFTPEGNIVSYMAYEYDKNGQTTKETSYDAIGCPKWSTSYEYGYLGNKIKETDYNQDDEITSFKTLEHDDDGNWRWVSHSNS